MIGSQSRHRLMYGLLYPAVLGSVFVTFIGVDLVNFSIHPRLVFGIIFVAHWTIQFVYVTLPEKDAKYTKGRFISDIVLLIGMNFSYYSLPSATEYQAGAFFTWFYAGISVIGSTVFFQIAFDIWSKQFEIRPITIAIDAYLLIAGLILFSISFQLPSFAENTIVVYCFIISTLMASIIHLTFSKKSADKAEIKK